MPKLRLTLGCLVFCLFACWRMQAQELYYGTSSATLASNTLDSVATNGSGNVILLTATGIDFNKVNRFTAIAVDGSNGKLFFVDGMANALWSVNLDGSGLTQVKGGLTSYPTDLALDVQNQKIFFTTSSTIQSNNTIQTIDYSGNNNAVLFTASGPVANGGNGVSRCTAIAVDLQNSKIFLADAGAQEVWSMTLDGNNLTALATTLSNSFPSDVAFDPAGQLVYFTVSSSIQSSNLIQRMRYNGTGLQTIFTAQGSIQRCTALDLDLPSATIYLSDAGSNTPALWRLPLGGGSFTSVLSGITATAKKVRYFSGSATRPPPVLTSIQISGTNVVLNATNGFAGGTYYVLTSTNVNTPLNQWLPVFTNVLGASGSFTLTLSNALASQLPHQFYILQVQ
jgi:hypothetical protein